MGGRREGERGNLGSSQRQKAGGVGEGECHRESVDADADADAGGTKGCGVAHLRCRVELW